MDRTEISTKAKELIIDSLDIRGEVRDDASFVDDLGADSLDIVELVMAIEKAFNIDIPDEDAEKIETVEDAINYIDRALNPAA